MTTWTFDRAPSRRTVVAASVGAVALVALVAAVWLWYAAGHRRAEEAYAAVLTRAEAARAPQSTAQSRGDAAQALEALLAEYPSSDSVSRAALTLGDLRFEDREYPKARAAYEIALARAGGPTVRTLARRGIGYTWEAEGNAAKAVEAYASALEGRGPKDFGYEQTLLDLARVQALAGRQADAAETYRRLLRDVPGSRFADEARTRLASLEGASAKK